jgi:hypothetical protein
VGDLSGGPPTLCAGPTLPPADALADPQGRSLVCSVRATVAEKMSAPANPFKQPAGKGLGFYTGEDGYMYCDNLRVRAA